MCILATLTRQLSLKLTDNLALATYRKCTVAALQSILNLKHHAASRRCTLRVQLDYTVLQARVVLSAQLHVVCTQEVLSGKAHKAGCTHRDHLNG